MSLKPELLIIMDNEGIKFVQIRGPVEAHIAGHDLYFTILDLIQDFDKAVQQRLVNQETEYGDSGK